jgi:hypothetical protein
MHNSRIIRLRVSLQGNHAFFDAVTMGLLDMPSMQLPERHADLICVGCGCGQRSRVGDDSPLHEED